MKEGRAHTILYSVGSFLIPLLLFLGIWELVSLSGLVKQVLIPPPSRVFIRMAALVRPEAGPGLLDHIFTSLYRLVIGFSAGASAGIGLGLAMGSNRYIYGYFNPIITVLMPVPGITWTPILVLILGFGDPTLITVTFIASFFPLVYNTTIGVRSLRNDLLWAARIMGAGRRDLFFRVLLPSSSPHIITGLKLGLARGWRTLIAVEMIAATLRGLGYLIWDAKAYQNTEVIYAGILVMAIIYAAIEKSAFGFLERTTIERWGMVTEIG